jgi:hypothetical protein
MVEAMNDFYRPNTDGNWYACEIIKNKCRRCGKPATHEVYNSANGNVGSFCKTCAAKVVKEKRV